MDAIYARQSIDKRDSLSIEGQIELCRKYAGNETQVYQDKGFSGKNTKRPAFTSLMQDVEAGKINRVIVYRLDRFSRSIADFSRLWEILKQHNVDFLSVTENFETGSAMGRAMLNIVLVFAQLERETTSERVRDNYHHRFALGAWPGGPAPYGFNLTNIVDGGRKVSSLVANESAEIVRWIFEEYAKPETSLRGIAKELTAKTVHGPKREAWDNVTISRLLHSPLYVQASQEVYWYYLSKGLQIEHDVEAFDNVHACNVIGRRDRSRNKYNSLDGQMLTVANHKGFIPADLWLKVQDKLEKNPQISRANVGKYTWLTGLLKCGKCGYSAKVNFSKAENKARLVCSGRSNLSVCDAAIHVDLKVLEQYVADEIKSILAACPPEEIYPDTAEGAKELLAVEQKIERLVSALAESSDVSATYITRQIEKLHKEKETLLDKVTPTNHRVQQLDFDALDFQEKKLVAAEFIEKILLGKDEVNIVWKV